MTFRIKSRESSHVAILNFVESIHNSLVALAFLRVEMSTVVVRDGVAKGY